MRCLCNCLKYNLFFVLILWFIMGEKWCQVLVLFCLVRKGVAGLFFFPSYPLTFPCH